MNRSNRTLQRADHETYDELERVLQEMDDFVDAIIVEGVRDKEALEGLEVTKEIVMCSSKPDAAFVDYLSGRHKKVTILTDYDRAGKEINKRLSVRLERAGVKVENQYRSRIGRILGLRGMRSIESVNSLKKRVV